MLKYLVSTYIEGERCKMKHIVFVLLFTAIYAEPLPLTVQEKQIIQAHEIKCISTGLWAPFNLVKNKKLVGIGFDYWNLIREKLGIKNGCKKAESWTEVLEEIKNRRYDMTIASKPTEDRLKYAVFSKPYVTYPIVIATKNDVGFIHNIDLIKNKTIAVGEGYAMADILKKNYPELKIKYVESIDKALELVDKGKVFATIETLPVLAYKLNKNKFFDLKISGSIPYTFPIGIMFRKDYVQLLPLINKAIDSITQEEKDKINKHWIVISHEKKIASKYFYALLGAVLVIISFFGIWLLLLKKEIMHKNKTEKKLKQLVTIDSLTSIFNRYMLDMTLDKEIAVAKRHNVPLSVVFFDINGFKKINDEYGHKLGDHVLRELSKLIQNSIRESDIFGRWGGDEFLLILLNSKEEEAVIFAKHLDETIQKHVFDKEIAVSCSFGVTSYKTEDTRQSMMHRVDKNFYDTKRDTEEYK